LKSGAKGAALWAAAGVAWAFGIAGLIFWCDYSNLKEFIVAPHLTNDAIFALAIGALGMIFGITVSVLALQDSRAKSNAIALQENK